MLRAWKFFCAEHNTAMTKTADSKQRHPGMPERPVRIASVVANEPLCREHYRLTLDTRASLEAEPGQFIHIGAAQDAPFAHTRPHATARGMNPRLTSSRGAPVLRRAFSIAGLRHGGDGTQIDLIYRVVGVATRWMSTLHPPDRVSFLGPLGRGFSIDGGKSTAWLVAGGVGLPPMLWLSQVLASRNRRSVAFCGAQRADLLALSLGKDPPPAENAERATLSCSEFAASATPVVISTDDGSAGFRGHIGAAMAAYHRANPIGAGDLVVYTCGPERMMRFVAEYCTERGIACQVCMERSMACGTGLCQSCVLPVRDATAPDGWRYDLCCTHGPVFDAQQLIWDLNGR